MPRLTLPALIIADMVVVSYVCPDPKEIGLRLEHYYPGYAPPARPHGAPNPSFRAVDFLQKRPTRLAIVSNCAAQGNMSIVMAHAHSPGPDRN